MSLWFKAGPFGLSSRGRVGVSVGPVSWTGGGRRGGGGGGSLLGFLLFLGLIIAAGQAIARYWYVSVPAILLLGYLGWRYLQFRRKQREAALAAWLAGPPPPLTVPSRFTEAWFQQNVPYLHPGQVPPLIEALGHRGWSEDKIVSRVGPYLQANPYLPSSTDR